MAGYENSCWMVYPRDRSIFPLVSTDSDDLVETVKGTLLSTTLTPLGNIYNLSIEYQLINAALLTVLLFKSYRQVVLQCVQLFIIQTSGKFSFADTFFHRLGDTFAHGS